MIVVDLQHYNESLIGDVNIDEDQSGYWVSFYVGTNCLVALSIEQARRLAAQLAAIPDSVPGDRYAKQPQETTP